MSNLYSRRLIRAGQRYKLTIVRPTMFDLECWEGQGKSRFFFSFLLSLIPLVKISFSHQALVSFAAVLRLVTQRPSSTFVEEEHCVTSLRRHVYACTVNISCGYHDPTFLQGLVTMSSHMSLPDMSEKAGPKTWVE